MTSENDKDLKIRESHRTIIAKNQHAKNTKPQVFPDLCGDMPTNYS